MTEFKEKGSWIQTGNFRISKPLSRALKNRFVLPNTSNTTPENMLVLQVCEDMAAEVATVSRGQYILRFYIQIWKLMRSLQSTMATYGLICLILLKGKRGMRHNMKTQNRICDFVLLFF